MKPVDVEAWAHDLLTPLGVHVGTRIPSTRPASLIRATRAGGARRNLVQSDPVLLVECWAPTSVAAFALAAQAWDLFDQSGLTVSLSEPVNFPDPDTTSPRYQFTAQPTVILEESA